MIKRETETLSFQVFYFVSDKKNTQKNQPQINTALASNIF